MKKIKVTQKNVYVYIVLFLITLILSLLCLNSSPLFKGVPEADSTVFQVMGKGILNNQIMYKQLFDHKGPIVYFINALALLINKDIGLFIVEIIFLYIGVVFVYKTSRKLLSNIYSIFICCIYYLLIFSTLQGGNLTEEYAITFSAIAFYYMFFIFYEQDLKKRNWIIIGATFAINLFIKPTYIAIWIAFGITALIFFVKNKRYKELINGIKYAFLGAIIITIPVLCYIIWNNFLYEFIDAYLITNFKYSSGTIHQKIKTFIKLIYITKYYLAIIVVIVMNIFICLNKNITKEIKVFISLSFLITLILSATAPYTNPHYLISNALPIAIELMLIIYMYKDLDIPQILYYVVMIFIILSICYYNTNVIKKYDVTETRKCLDSIKHQYLNEEDQILVLGNNSYYYLYLNKQPKFKYFFQYPIIIYNNHIAIETLNYIKTERPKLIIKNLSDMQIKLFGNEVEKILEEDYNYIENNQLSYWKLKE